MSKYLNCALFSKSLPVVTAFIIVVVIVENPPSNFLLQKSVMAVVRLLYLAWEKTWTWWYICSSFFYLTHLLFTSWTFKFLLIIFMISFYSVVVHPLKTVGLPGVLLWLLWFLDILTFSNSKLALRYHWFCRLIIIYFLMYCSSNFCYCFFLLYVCFVLFVLSFFCHFLGVFVVSFIGHLTLHFSKWELNWIESFVWWGSL